jgi:acetoin utilization deacetylase AcuC-like enzyme
MNTDNGMQPPFVVVDDELFDLHQSETLHPERPERLHALRSVLASFRAPVSHSVLPPRDASDDEIARVHTNAYIERIGQVAGLRGYFDADTFHAPRSIAAARRAAGGTLAVAEELATGRATLGVALVRPPGHHATSDSAMGFCILNNVAVAAAHARSLGVERVAIVDWDVHHGNGTEEIFYGDPSVLYVSLHQAPFYPGTGSAADCGSGEGRGYTVNVPLSPNADTDVYQAAVRRVIAPILNQFAPDLLLISAGFDAHIRDPLASMRLDDSSYALLFDELVSALPDAGARPPRVGIVLEGGYDLDALAGSFRNTIEAALARSDTGPGRSAATPTPNLRDVHEQEIRRAEARQRDYWRLA